MNGGNLIFLLLLAGGIVFMFSMHRGGHAHGGGGGGGGGGGCGGGGHSHGGGHGNGEQEPTAETGEEPAKTPILGPPGTKRTAAPHSGPPAPASGHRHGGH